MSRPRAALITPTETAVLEWVEKGLTNKGIAMILGITVPTVKSHLRDIFNKLHAETRGEAVYKWRQLSPEKNPDYCQQCYQSLKSDGYFTPRRQPERHKNAEIANSGGFNSKKVVDSLTKKRGRKNRRRQGSNRETKGGTDKPRHNGVR